MQLSSDKEFFNKKCVVNSHGYHSPGFRNEPIERCESDSSSFHFSEKQFIGLGTTYGESPFTTGYSANPNYTDASVYGPGFDNPFSPFYAFRKSL